MQDIWSIFDISRVIQFFSIINLIIINDRKSTGTFSIFQIKITIFDQANIYEQYSQLQYHTNKDLFH